MSDDLFDIFDEESSLPELEVSTGDVTLPQAVGGDAHTVRAAVIASVAVESKQSVSNASAPPADAATASLLANTTSSLSVSTPDATRLPPEASPSLLSQPAALLPHRSAVPSGSPSSAVLVIRPAPPSSASSRSRYGDDDGSSASSASRAPPPPAAVLTEPNSRIRVRRATVALEQLPVRMAEFPFASFAVFRQAVLGGGGQTPAPLTCVGVVTRKSDPKQSAGQTRASRYAVLSLWNMDGISPSPETELSFLLCSGAFEVLYSHLVRGSVVAVSNVGMCPRKSGGSGSVGQDVLLRIADHTAVRQLGFAADLGTCVSTSHKSSERCQGTVNTARSQHCSYHVSDLRKVARGGASAGGGSTPRTTTTTTSSSGVSKSTSSVATVKGGALTSHLTFSPLTSLAPARAAPLPAAAARPGSARLAASQQLLRQPSFFAVRGGTGLPVEDAARQRDANSAGSGVYGGVQSGAPLPLKQQVGLRPVASYPSAQKLGVSSRGRDVLEAARRQAVHSEEERLLRRSLLPTAAPSSHSVPEKEATKAAKGSVQQGKAAATATARSRGVAGGTAKDERVRERDANVEPASTLASDAQQSKKTRTDAPGTPASHASSAVPSAAARGRTPGVDAQRVEELRAQFQPLLRGTPAAFAPLSGHGSVHAVIGSAVQPDYRHAVVMTSGGGSGGGAQSALLRAAAQAAKDVSASSKKADAAAASSGAKAQEGGGEVLPVTLLGAAAESLTSQHDHLRGEADRQRLLAFVDKQITKEKALEALEAVTQQEIKAYYCYGCHCWYTKPPTTCAEQRHRTELKPALKKYIKCEHCSYKTYVIGGEDARGWKVFPRCPRCHAESYWVRGNAAPQIAGPVEEPIPL